MIRTSDWYKCYRDSWQNVITPESFVHPAKFSRALIRRIYEHCFEEGWLRPGMTVCDPFAGVALGALHAMKHGLNWVGIELEEKFVDLGQQNIDLWNERYLRMPGWGTARMIQGDSRRLGEVLAGAGLCLTSPPFGKAQTGGGINAKMRGEGRYKLTTRLPGSSYQPSEHGNSPRNLGNLPAAGFEVAISSPPFGAVEVCQDKSFKLNDGRKAPPQGQEGYGATAGQLGRETSDTFWSASRTILEQLYQVLIPGGHAVFVLKAFVRKGKVVDFPSQWRELCEAVGFTTLHVHRAWLVEERGAQYTLDGGLDVKRVKRCSFFRRLHERKYPHLAIDFEKVLCLVK